MNKSWISIQLESADFPSCDFKAKDKGVKITSKDQADSILNKLKNRKK